MENVNANKESTLAHTATILLNVSDEIISNIIKLAVFTAKRYKTLLILFCASKYMYFNAHCIEY